MPCGLSRSLELALENLHQVGACTYGGHEKAEKLLAEAAVKHAREQVLELLAKDEPSFYTAAGRSLSEALRGDGRQETKSGDVEPQRPDGPSVNVDEIQAEERPVRPLFTDREMRVLFPWSGQGQRLRFEKAAHRVFVSKLDFLNERLHELLVDVQLEWRLGRDQVEGLHKDRDVHDERIVSLENDVSALKALGRTLTERLDAKGLEG